jgi:hypothetical protein
MSYKFNPFTGTLDLVLNPEETLDQYVFFAEGLTEDSPGIKGQWSYSSIQGNYWICIALNTWIEIYGKNIIDAFDFVKSSEVSEGFVPISLITGPSSPAIKGQWSFKAPYLYKAIATNTWVRYAVATVF